MAYVMYILRDAFLNELYFDGKNITHKFNLDLQTMIAG